MRVISGSARGCKLFAPDGGLTRPTADRIKEDMFNLFPDVSGKAVLDLFAGTGALGIEALSRGAASAVFVDSNREALVFVKKNLEKTRLSARSEIILSTAQQYIRVSNSRFDLLYMDPPYNQGVCADIIGLLQCPGCTVLNRGAMIILEVGKDEARQINLLRGLTLYKRKDYKITSLLLLLFER